MSLCDEDPDRMRERFETQAEEQMLRQAREDRVADYTPALPEPKPRVTRAMVVLSWTVLHGKWHDAREAARALAAMVIEADGT